MSTRQEERENSKRLLSVAELPESNPLHNIGWLSSGLRTRPPVGEEGEEVGCAEVADPNASHLD